jgi:hypothetical protein
MLIRAANGDIDAARSGIVLSVKTDKVQADVSGSKDMRLGVQHAPLEDARRHGRHGATEGRLQAPNAAQHSLRHDRRPLGLRRGHSRSLGHPRRAALMGGFGFYQMS